MKTLMVDMDDVITANNFQRVMEEYLGYTPDYNSFDSYYLQDLLGDKKEDFFKKFKDINLYEKAELLKDCYDVLKKLSKHYKIYICTDYLWKEIIPYNGNTLKSKYEWLYQKLDFIEPKNYIFTADKSIVATDIKIDDKLSNLSGAKTKLLFTAWHNKNLTEKDLDDAIRVNSWKEIEKILLEKTEDKNER